jgi:hypothetical protein
MILFQELEESFRLQRPANLERHQRRPVGLWRIHRVPLLLEETVQLKTSKFFLRYLRFVSSKLNGHLVRLNFIKFQGNVFKQKSISGKIHMHKDLR